jgi:cytochrome b
MSSSKTYVWDLPVRLCHLAYMLLIPALWYTGTEGMLDWHFKLAYCLLGVLVFRIVWGFIGNRYARFKNFQYLPSQPTTQGHQFPGSYSVLVLLSLMLLQIASGLVGTDDFMYDGPLREVAPALLVEWLAPVHKWNINLLLGWIGLHIVIVGLYQLLTDNKLIKPMITGFKHKD